MLCAKPYVKTPTGIKKLHTILSEEARRASTPFGCGQCLPCRINRARIWQHRLLLEQSVATNSVFATLTYNDEHVPEELKPEDLTKYIKRLRKSIEPEKIRYFAIGEYGDETWRPHYHLAIFGLDILQGEIIDKCWDLGFTYTGDLTKDSASYITGYVTKNLTKSGTVELNGKSPEFMRSSRMGDGGIGRKAIKLISEKLKATRYWNKNTILTQLSHGKKSMPLGNYLTNKFIEDMEIPEEEKSLKTFEWQNEIYDLHFKSNKNYYQSLVQENENKRKRQSARFKIYRKRKSI